MANGRYFFQFGAIFLALVSASVHAHDGVAHPERLALGDGKISDTPKRGFVVACGGRFPGGGGAHRVGEWIKDGMWNPQGKPTVEGDIVWPNAAISIVREGSERVVTANNLPLHPSGVFPIRPGSAAHAYDRNPHPIREQTVLLRLPADPQMAPTVTCVPLGMIGFALSGVAIYNAFDVQGRDAPAYEIQDKCNGHPERGGQYHYHDWSNCLSKDANGRMYAANEPVGWMLDGFPILRPTDANGKWIKNIDLDECHGAVGPVVIDGTIVNTYHYRFTREYPYTIGCFKGQPASTR